MLAILLGVSKLLRERRVLDGRYGSLVWPILMILLGMQLAFYNEH